ncbi:MAG TPA: hypothetical protein VIY29_23360, partial [Ktedonobacteraceae bacterium]
MLRRSAIWQMPVLKILGVFFSALIVLSACGSTTTTTTTGATSTSGTSCTGQSQPPIKIGISLSLT